MVTKRTLYLVEWDWMKQFQCYHQTGKTNLSEWSNHLRFAKFSKLPDITETYEVEKGLVHLTKGVPLNLFKIKTVAVPF